MTRHHDLRLHGNRHYSYTVYEEDSVTGGFDAARFSGPVGRHIADHQARFLDNVLQNITGQTVLDLGAGTGRTSLHLGSRGAHVMAADASGKMLNILREKAFLQGVSLKIARIDAHDLPFDDQSFDIVLSFRMLMHVVNWRKTLSETCRVTRRTVILDFPPACGFAGLAPLIHPVLRVVKKHHQSYRVFRISDVLHALNIEGFTVTAIDRHLVLPFGLHRLVNRLGFTLFTENFLEKIGFRDVFGAPVTLVAHRKETA